MTEILTESFCERCGTRYTFESAAPRRSRVGRVRTVSRGLRNFVLSDETTFSEAMADARSEEERSATTNQLDAFHKTFNFCLTCRQYTCGNCWNTAEGRCLTCMPLPGMAADAQLLVVPAIAFEPNGNGVHADDEGVTEPGQDGWPEADLGPEAWPDADVGVERIDLAAAAAAFASDDEAELVATADELVAMATTAELDAAEFDGAEFDAAELDAAKSAAWTADDDELVMLDDAAVEARINGVAPGQSVEDAVAAYEAQLAAEEEQERRAAALAAAAVVGAAAIDVEPEAEVVEEPEVVAFVAEPEPEAFVEPEALVVVAEAEPEPEVLAEAEPEPEVLAEAEPEPEVLAEAEVVAEPQPEVVAEPQPEVVAEAEPDLAGIAAAAVLAVAPEPEFLAPEPEFVAAEPEPVVAPEPEPHHPGLAAAALLAAASETPAPAAREDVVEQPTWPVAPGPVEPAVAPPVQPAPTPEPVQPGQNPWLTVAPDDGSAAPQWPVAPAWRPAAGPRNGQPATLAGRPLVPQDNAAALWAASAREVLTGGAPVPQPVAAPSLTPQPCVSCGLSLSANARFCRRCGTRQG